MTEKGKQGREKNTKAGMETLGRKNNSGNELDIPFTVGELKKPLANTGKSEPGKDGICYIMINHLSEEGLNKFLMLSDKVWKEG